MTIRRLALTIAAASLIGGGSVVAAPHTAAALPAGLSATTVKPHPDGGSRKKPLKCKKVMIILAQYPDGRMLVREKLMCQ